MNPAENYILNQKEPFKGMLLHVQWVIETTVPQADLKYKWGIPSYYLNDSPFCYLNVPIKKSYIDIGFWRSAHLTKHLDKMTMEGRKMIKSLRYSTLEEIDDTVLKDVLTEAYAVRDKKFWKI